MFLSRDPLVFVPLFIAVLPLTITALPLILRWPAALRHVLESLRITPRVWPLLGALQIGVSVIFVFLEGRTAWALIVALAVTAYWFVLLIRHIMTGFTGTLGFTAVMLTVSVAAAIAQFSYWLSWQFAPCGC